MDQQQQNITQGKEYNSRHVNDTPYIIKRNWYWFIFSIIICLSLAFIYIAHCPQIYTRTASVLIKDNSAGPIHNQSSANPVGLKNNVENEAFILKSKQLMLKVARRLNLDTDYIINEGLRKTELYSHSPVIVSFPEASETDRFSFVATPVSENEIQLSDFSKNKSETVTVNLKENNTVSTSVGKIMVKTSIYYGTRYFNIPITIIKKNLEETAQYYSDNLNVSVPEKSASVIKISLNDISIPRNEDIINTVISTHNEDAINDKNQIIRSTLEFINERLYAIQRELEKVDTDMESVKFENQSTDINPATGMTLKSSNLFSQEIAALQNRRIVARNISDYILDPKHSLEPIPVYTISDANIEMKITEYNNVLLRRNKLISDGNDNPAIEDLNNTLKLLKENIIRHIGNLVLSTDSKIKNIRKLESEKPPTIQTRQIQVSPAEYKQKANESLYLYLLEKREDNALVQAIIDSDIQIIDLAKGPDEPVSPKIIPILLAALLTGIILPAIILGIQAMLNTAVGNRKELESNLSLPFLGDIPYQRKKKQGDIVVRANSNEPISEAFRAIRTNIGFVDNQNQSSKVIMITSFDSGAGKTFVSTNLSMSFALTNKKVILLDLDMRKGTLSSRLSKINSGITDFLSGKVNNTNEIIIKKALHDTLDFIPAGSVPQPNPSGLLLGDRFAILIQDLKKHYDYIILDVPSSDMTANALSRVSDTAIYIIRANKTDRRQLPEIENLYRQKKFQNMGTILNGVDYKKFSNRYYEYE